MDMNTMLLAMVFGSIGLGLFVYGRKAERIPHLAAGLALMVCPYVIHGIVMMIVVGTALAAAPFCLDRR